MLRRNYVSAEPVVRSNNACNSSHNCHATRRYARRCGRVLPSINNRRWPDAPPKKAVLQLWRRNGLKPGSIANYQRVLGVFFGYCSTRGLSPVPQLSVSGRDQFWRWYMRHCRRCHDSTALRTKLSSALRAYAWAATSTGRCVPSWKKAPVSPLRPSIITAYVVHAREHRGLAESGLARDAVSIEEFLAALKRRRRDWRQVRLIDIDDFLIGLSPRLGPATVGRCACALRGWLRFLHATGRLSYDLSSAVVSPVRRIHDRPPRAWPWTKIKKLLHGINPATGTGRRDRAQFLLMSTYGLGAAEVLQLRLDDIDWRGQRLHVVRRKTKTPITLPLLPEVARSLAAYIRRGRPSPSAHRQLFLSHSMPHEPFSQSGVLRHRVRTWARRAGLEAPILGTHLFRHSHATRQVVLGTSMKILGDILGHRDPETTSIYARAAVQRLRRLALPVPR